MEEEKVTDAQIIEALKKERVNQKEQLYGKIPEENRELIVKVLTIVINVGLLLLAGIIIGAITGIL